MAAYAAHTMHQLKYSSPNRSNKNKKTNKSHTKEPTFRKVEDWGKRGQENGTNAEKDKAERATGTRQKDKRRYIEK